LFGEGKSVLVAAAIVEKGGGGLGLQNSQKFEILKQAAISPGFYA
jgi:hypothetical protein